MKVFKFGGASIKDAESLKNAASIIKSFLQEGEKLVVVVSAMGKTTNALEDLTNSFYHKRDDCSKILEEIKNFHLHILNDLFDNKKHQVFEDIQNTFIEIDWQLEDEPVGTFDFEYDQMVAIGELLSSKILSAYLNQIEIHNKWIDARDLIRTDNGYRAAKIDWDLTKKLTNQTCSECFNESNHLIITQGFIGSTSENFTSTLGREGSDFSASIFANVLDAEELIIWKDVEGMQNADPKYFENTVRLNNISYKEAVELAYFGASVIHPKTIKPLENKNIPLQVKSFINPTGKGTLINNNSSSDSLIASYILKPNQMLISISPLDFSFIGEDNLSLIFTIFFKHNVSIDTMQNSAISFSVCVSESGLNIDSLINDLKEYFKVSFNSKMSLLTIRHYDEAIIKKLTVNKKIFMEQRSRNTARFVIKD